VIGRSATFARQPRLHLHCAIFGLLLLGGCGAPGEPQPPSPPVPSAINDLTAHQQGNGVRLIFTLPTRTAAGERLSEPPSIEIFRGTVKSSGSVDNKTFQLVYTIPAALADVYQTQGKVQFTDPIAPEELRAHPGSIYAYRVRTRASKKKDSADSNTGTEKVYPVADRIPSLNAQVTQAAIELSWPTPSFETTAGSNETISGYHIYRGELDPAAALPSANDLSQAKWKSPPILLAPSQSNSYRDMLFEFGKTYAYQVRSVIIADGNPIESDDSVPAIVTPRDTFPPTTPQNLVAAEIPDANNTIAVDLSWSINLETDLAGYHVYRTEKQGDRGELVQADLLLSPAYRDTAVQAGHKYWYSVTAVDRAGNESAPSEQILADLTQPLP
jgi:hypothetical protein